MNEPDLIQLFRAVAAEVTEKPLPELAPDTSIAELGIDSVSVAEIVARVEDALGIEVPAADWLRVRTLEEFVRAIQRARDQKPDLPGGAR
ncbi:MAG TPA: acyl carrier protein [Candidatus Saccharimonadales bacterium]|nr:acyl carrier protein [Candidatus Saccharimonadales bacterium]